MAGIERCSAAAGSRLPSATRGRRHCQPWPDEAGLVFFGSLGDSSTAGLAQLGRKLPFQYSGYCSRKLAVALPPGIFGIPRSDFPPPLDTDLWPSTWVRCVSPHGVLNAGRTHPTHLVGKTLMLSDPGKANPPLAPTDGAHPA